MHKMFLFPSYVDLLSASSYSPKLFKVLGSRPESSHRPSESLYPGIKHMRWDGTIDTLPTDERVIVRASSQLPYDWEKLGAFYAEHGHLCFYDDKLVDAEGVKPTEDLLEAARKFLDQKTDD